VEWLWVVALALIIFGPIVWAATKDRSGGAPSEDDLSAGSTVTDSIRHIASGDQTPRGSGSGRGGPLLPR
jgi:hypothetical protein